LRKSQQREAAPSNSSKRNEVALRAARQQYAQGFADFLNVNAAQAQLLLSRVDLANATGQMDTGLVALYRALGGGWEASDTVIASSPPPSPPGSYK